MTSKTAPPGITVTIPPDRLTASLTIRANVRRDDVTTRSLTAVVEAAGVPIDSAVAERIEHLVRRAALESGEVEAVIADVRARNAGIEWAPGFDPISPRRETRKSGVVDHYSRSAFVRVKQGDRIATVRPADACLDVTGAPFPEYAAATRFTIDDATLHVEHDGAVLANLDGVVLIAGTVLFVSRRLEIPKSVDFSTGNIDFDGSIHVGGGIKDRFVVTATEDIAVDGLIEGATINAGGSLCCGRGMVAKERGTINVAHHVDIGFLNNVRGSVGRNLNVRGEIMNCELRIARDLVCPTGAIMGGEITVTGRVVLGTLGSPRVIPTTLIAGAGGQPAEDLTRVDELLITMAEEIEQKASYFEMMQQSVQHMTGAQKEAHADFGAELKATLERYAGLKARRERTAKAVAGRRKVDIQVSKQINPGAVIVVGGVAWRLDQVLAGPVQVCLDRNRRVVYRVASGEARPISHVASLVAEDAA